VATGPATCRRYYYAVTILKDEERMTFDGAVAFDLKAALLCANLAKAILRLIAVLLLLDLGFCMMLVPVKVPAGCS
jgi:hypothetical protein